MADDAIIVSQFTVLPHEIAKVISNTTTVAPAYANDTWYYKLTSVSHSITDLMAGNCIYYAAIDEDTAPVAIHTADKVKFLYVKNTDASNAVYIVIDGGTASTSAGDALYIGAGQDMSIQIPNTTVAEVHAISSTSTVTCLVAALLDDVA